MMFKRSHQLRQPMYKTNKKADKCKPTNRSNLRQRKLSRQRLRETKERTQPMYNEQTQKLRTINRKQRHKLKEFGRLSMGNQRKVRKRRKIETKRKRRVAKNEALETQKCVTK